MCSYIASTKNRANFIISRDRGILNLINTIWKSNLQDDLDSNFSDMLLSQ